MSPFIVTRVSRLPMLVSGWVGGWGYSSWMGVVIVYPL